MFDVGFSELVVIAVVTLVVVGPKRLPMVARVAGRVLGQFNRYVAQVKSEVQKEMEKAELDTLRKEFEAGAESIKTSLRENVQELSSLENRIMQEVANANEAINPQSINASDTDSLNINLPKNVPGNANSENTLSRKTLPGAIASEPVQAPQPQQSQG